MGGLFGSHNTVTRADLLTEFQLNKATYGETVPVVLGTTRINGNIIDYYDFTAHEHRTTQRVGKGGGSRNTNITYTYTVATCIALCEGPIKGVNRVWVNKDVYTYPNEKVPFDLFRGDEGQSPWNHSLQKRPERALPYSGLSYMAGVIDLGENASMPQYNFEVQGLLLDSGDGVDVNPADYILYILTDERNGIGFSKNDIDLESLDRARQYWAAADLLISTPMSTKSKKAQDIINTICDITGVFTFWSQNKLKFVPTCMDRLEHNGHVYVPNRTVLYDLNSDDLLPNGDGTLVSYERKDSAEAYNQSNVEYISRKNNYEKETVTFEVTSDVLSRGLRPASKVTTDYIYTKERAMFIAEQLAKKYVYSRNVYSFSLDWAFSTLEVGDLVTLTDETCGLNRRVVTITQIKESIDGQLDVTAISVPDGIYSSAKYNLHANERPTIDRTITPSSVCDVTIFQPVGQITQNGLELWASVNAGEHWGGCTVWVSDTGDKYIPVGQIVRRGRMGTLNSQLGVSDTSISVTMQHGELLSGTEQDAIRGNTMMYCDGELLSYTTATLTATNQYTLDGLVRGQKGTRADVQAKGQRIVRLDETVFKYALRKEDIGKKIFIKFTSVNEFGMNEQGLQDVQAYEYTIKKYHIPQVNDLTLTTKYRQVADGVVNYDVVIHVDPPNIDSYENTAIYYRVGGATDNLNGVVIPAGTKGDSFGTLIPWKFAGYASRGEFVIPQATIGEMYYIKAIVRDKFGYTSDDNTAIVKSIKIQSKTEIPATPQNFSVVFSDKVNLSWSDVVNADVDYYEIRTNDTPGLASGLIARVTGTSTMITLANRQGSVYLYAHNTSGKYGYPAVVEYNKTKPLAPSNVTVKPILQGLSISVPPIPIGSNGINVYVDDKKFYTTSPMFTFHGAAGVHIVRVAYVDPFGEGELSGEVTATIAATIDPELIGKEALSLANMDKAITEKLNSGAEAKAEIINIVGALNGNPSVSKYSAIAQLANGLELRVKANELISKINMSPETITIDGKYIHITGDTKFDKNVIVGGALQANSVTADKLQVDSLSAITATIGTLRTKTNGARIEIKDNLIEVYDDNDRLRVKMGVW